MHGTQGSIVFMAINLDIFATCTQ